MALGTERMRRLLRLWLLMLLLLGWLLLSGVERLPPVSHHL